MCHCGPGERLTGHDTFLSGALELRGRRFPVRILTFDDVTVLQPATPRPQLLVEHRWEGTLHLAHGQRTRTIPSDLEQSARDQNAALDALSPADLHYALTYLSEATTPEIRRARIAVIVAALPAAERSTV